MQLETTILRGLPVTVEFRVAPAEPDVGIMCEYFEDINILVGNRYAPWAEKQLSDDDWEEIRDQCSDYAQGYDDD